MLDRTKNLTAAGPAAVSLYRMVVSLLFTCHGASTVLGAFGNDRTAVGHWPGWWAGLIQLVCGVLVFIGIGDAGTRVASLLASGSMAYAYFTVHQKHAVWPIQNGGDLAVMFCWSFLLIAILGPGMWTLTSLLARTSPAARPVPRTSASPESS